MCGRAIAPRRGPPARYCKRCREKVVGDDARARRVRCRECSKRFQAPSLLVKYCSDPCRKEGYARSVRDSQRARRARGYAARCRECGGPFTAHNRTVGYCSDECRNRGSARSRSGGAPGGAGRPATVRGSTAAKCRVCGRRFDPGILPGRPRVYCSEACRVEGRLAANLVYVRRGLADPKKRAAYYLHRDVTAARRRRGSSGAGGSGKGRKKR